MYPSNDPTATEPNPDPAQAEGEQGNPLTPLEVTEEFLSRMFDEIEAAEGRRKEYEKEWDILLKAYTPIITDSSNPEEVKTNTQFRNVHSKLAQVFHQPGELTLEPRSPMKDAIGVNPMTGAPITSEDAIAMKREVLNDMLGDDGTCVAWTMDEVITDCLLWAAHGVVFVGYTPTIKEYQEPVMIPDPNFVAPPPMPGSVLGLEPPSQPTMVPLTGEDGQPVTRPRKAVIHEDWYIRRFSPKKALISADLRSPRIQEDACWTGRDLFFTAEKIKSVYGFDVSTLITPNTTDDRVGENSKEDPNRTKQKKYHLYELFLRACEYDPAQPHPKAIYQLVLMAGIKDKALVYRPHPDQTFDELGRLTEDSIDSFPIKFCSLRDFPDSPYAYSDSAHVHNEAKVLNTSRRQSVRLRDAAISKMLYDEDALTPDEVNRIKNMKVGDFLGVKAGLLANGADKIIAVATQPTRTRDDYQLERATKQDMDEALGVSATDAGVLDDTGAKTATEVNTATTKSKARLAKDQQRAVRFYMSCVRHFDTLVVRYATTERYVSFVGVDGAKRLELWNGKFWGCKWSYGMKLDSQLIMDVARDRQQLLTYEERTRGNPIINPYPIHKKIARAFGLDPVEVLVNPAMIQAGLGPPVVPPTGETPTPSMPVDGPASAPRQHIATGARPNQPEIGQHPNTPRPR